MELNKPISLRKVYKSISFGQDPGTWNVMVNKVLEAATDESAHSFINELFGLRGKSAAFKLGVYNEHQFYERNLHSFSVFMLGLRRQGFVKEAIEKKMLFLDRSKCHFQFEYPWFLASLYHDIMD